MSLREDGQTTVEFIALLPLLVITTLLVVQLQLFVRTATTAEAAARAGALAARDGRDPVAAATASMPGADAARVRAIDVAGDEVSVQLAVPMISDLFTVRPWSVTRDATVPRS